MLTVRSLAQQRCVAKTKDVLSATSMFVCLYSGAHKYRSDQEHVRAPTVMRSASRCLSGGPCKYSKSTSTLSVFGFTGAESA